VVSPKFLRLLAFAFAFAFTLTACNGEGDDRPYLAFAGGGFIFNYRLATADYGFVARVERSLPEGSIIEAEFENPAGGAAIVLRQDAKAGRSSYVFRTPPLQGVRANHDYQVVLRLLDAEDKEIASYRRSYRSSADQSVLPESPPVIGPGHQQAPSTQ
jgi:hypothetical protein